MNYIIQAAHNVDEIPDQSAYSMHAHANYEICCFIEGNASFAVEGARYFLQSGDIMLMRKGESHYLILHSQARYERIVINFELPFLSEIDPEKKLISMFENRPLGMYNHYSAALFPNNNWMYFLNRICETNEPQKRLAYLLPLLGDLADCYDMVKNEHCPIDSDPVISIIRYINNHLVDNDLSLTVLCDHFFISKAHLNRIFKLSTGSTVWNYILVKRLLMARELLLLGQSPSEVYLKCGFQDYTTFFRAYKKYFNSNPKQDQA